MPHVFRKHFEELNVGDTVTTAKHTVTETGGVNFANVSGDNFYAHVDETSLEGTLFERRVAHGYFILSKAAGLFVDPKSELQFYLTTELKNVVSLNQYTRVLLLVLG